MSAEKISSHILFFYGLALMTSMAGIELFSALILLFTLCTTPLSQLKKMILQREYAIFGLLLTAAIISLAFNQYFEKILPTIGWFRWIFIFIFLSHVFKIHRGTSRSFLKGIVVGVLLSSLNSFTQAITHRDWIRGNKVIEYAANFEKTITRVTGFFNLPTTYGYVLALALFVLIFMVFFSGKKKFNSFALAALVLGFIALAMTYSRGAWLAFIGGLFLLLFFKKPRWILPAILAFSISSTLLYQTSSGFRERIGSVTSLNYYSNSQRIELWRANWHIFMDHPLFGAGMNQNDNLVGAYHEKLNHKEKYESHAHNTYLQFLAGTGVAGLLCFLIFISYFIILNIRLIYQSKGEKKSLAITLLAIQACFLIGYLFDCNFRDAEVRHSIMAYLALLASMKSSDLVGQRENIPLAQ